MLSLMLTCLVVFGSTQSSVRPPLRRLKVTQDKQKCDDFVFEERKMSCLFRFLRNDQNQLIGQELWVWFDPSISNVEIEKSSKDALIAAIKKEAKGVFSTLASEVATNLLESNVNSVGRIQGLSVQSIPQEYSNHKDLRQKGGLFPVGKYLMNMDCFIQREKDHTIANCDLKRFGDNSETPTKENLRSWAHQLVGGSPTDASINDAIQAFAKITKDKPEVEFKFDVGHHLRVLRAPADSPATRQPTRPLEML